MVLQAKVWVEQTKNVDSTGKYGTEIERKNGWFHSFIATRKATVSKSTDVDITSKSRVVILCYILSYIYI